MKSYATLEFINQTQNLVNPAEFEQIKLKLFKVKPQFRKSFLAVLHSGYSVKTAFKSYKILHWFAERNFIGHKLALRLINNVALTSEEGLFIHDFTKYDWN